MADILVQNQTSRSALDHADKPVFDRAMQLAFQWSMDPAVKRICVHVNGRGVYNPPEWLEYAVVLWMEDSQRPCRVFGIIQRKPGADVEVCS